ncbi:MAG: hypothetical protein COB23_06440 [Methylophaga sp.]|nr:MAG: hypothetical protein COB23_06440 [Methylophaga sp.]
MSGEKSKSSGELGETYIKSFLNLIGWTTSQSNESITCNEPEKHKKPNAKNGNTTHGIDELYTYESPMDSNTLIHSVMSVKHTDEVYPNSPNKPFKKHISDLAYAIECFMESNLLTANRDGYEIESEQIVGILFWLSSKSPKDKSIILDIKNPELKNDLLFDRIHVVDNERIEFITNSITLIKMRFPSYKFSFYYIDTPNNLSDRKKECSGNALPIEMLNSDIQVYKLEQDKETILTIVVKDSFDAESLKRIFGLAHRITNNLTSNVEIYFPSFEHERTDNKNIISRVKNQFKDKEFINSAYVYGYDIGFKDTRKNIETSKKVPKEEIEEQIIDDGKILPYGEHLRSLLSHSIITPSELKHILRDKGIFVCDSVKENTIPILTSMLLSPREFDILKEKQKTKEDKEKRHSSKFKTEKKVTIEALKSVLKTINLNDLDKQKIKNYKYKTPKASYATNQEKNELVLNYEIERYQRNKSWDEQTNFFRGSVILHCNDDKLEIIAKNISTSKETLEINQSIINHTKSKLIENNIISKTAKEEKILMNDMSNKEVLKFLLSFTNNDNLTDIEFLDIISIDIEIDETVSLPETSKIKWMESKIKNLKLDGKKIEDIEILTDDTHHEYLKCWGIIAEFKYDNLTAKGSSIIEFKFNTSNKGEFFIQISKSTFDKKIYKEKDIVNMILKDIDNIKYTNHSK